MYFLGITVVAYPRKTDSTVIKPRAPIAPRKTMNLECLIAIMAAIKKVLSPSSDTIMTDIDATNAWIKP